MAVVTLNRPDVHNAFDLRMQRELKRLWTSLRHHDPVRVVVLTGAGEKAFCTGIDHMEAIAEGYLGDRTNLDPMRAGQVSTPFMYNDPGQRPRLEVSTFVSLGTQYENIEGGQETFQGGRPEWRLR